MFEEGTDSAVDCDSAEAALVDHQLDGFGLCAPGVRRPHPRVKTGFVEVHDRNLLVDQLRNLYSELLSLIDELFMEGSMVRRR